MTEFKKFILENHPDPDTLIVDKDIFEQMCKLSEEFADEKLKLNNISNCCKNCYHTLIEEDYKHGACLECGALIK